jgi:uncharacterized metal-binding protein
MSDQPNPTLTPGLNTHENILFACFGGLSNTGITAALASMEAVKELGLRRVGIGCLPGLPVQNQTVYAKARAARKVITVDGCPFECSRKVVEAAGITIAQSIVLTRDIKMAKKSLTEDLGGDIRPMMEYISAEDVERAKEVIKTAIAKQ